MAFEMNQKTILIFLLVVLALWAIYPLFMAEGFDETGTVVIPEGSQRYGLRGEHLRHSCITKYYLNPDRQVMLNNGGGEMWVDNTTPEEQQISGCRKVKCPGGHDGYDNLDTCWQCASPKQPKIRIPDIWPHTS